ncbi:fibulin-1-like isoform X1 [Solea senegalensis]|uniref:Fibulin-1 n=1 Tax=Solea senegalensis TaxID=28829 RepID=A0AAV6SZQ0_SOLSE|nr:fibulin-1 isoform X1 [Solea senegalensis]KAG7522590.1 fibulin-1-like isoform X1 [Solea senegalensis]
MDPRVVLLCSMFGLLLGQGAEQISIEDCCKDGQKRGYDNEDCASLPLISESTTCRVVQEQCCVTVLEDNMCTTGINLAKGQGACDSLFANTCEIKTTKMCCDCCLLGKAIQERGLPCDHTVSVGYQCGLVSRACCVDGVQDNQTAPTAQPQFQNKTATNDKGDNSVLTDQCKGKCAHLCVGNDTCACLKGYKLKPDGKSCDDINECLLGSSNCRAGERCINTEGSFRCQREVSCGTGYELTDSNNCKDIDECETGIHNCGPKFECQNTQGSFRCVTTVKCGTGYIQDALGNCIDINECVSHTGPCHRGQICINTEGSFTCQRNSVNCGRGYHLNEEGTRCVDIDECKSTEQVCAGHGCINLVGTYRCECQTGYMFNSISRTCDDSNECRHYPGRLCAHKCENTPGSYKCSCTIGFKLASDGRNCDDLNECETNPCSQECANVYGSYQCYCRRGYQLSDIDGITCEDIDECALPTGGHICSYRCHNTPGSFHCSCPIVGYTLAPNGRTCQDIDECVTGTHTCSENESCFNIQGGFRCLSFECPNNYRRVGETAARLQRTDTVRCIKSCQPSDIACVLDPVHSVSHTFISLPTYREFTKPEEIVFLKTTVPAYGPYHLGNYDVKFNILEGNAHNAFDVIKRIENGYYMGVVRQVKPLIGPLTTVLKLSMQNLTNQGDSSQNIINVYVFVAEFWF